MKSHIYNFMENQGKNPVAAHAKSDFPKRNSANTAVTSAIKRHKIGTA